jgi:hypothetical protein
MLTGVLQRAAVAILLMGTMLAPLGTCLQQTHKSAHSCCTPATAPDSAAQANCCTARAPLPAVVVATALSAPAPMTVAREFVASSGISSPSAFSVAAFTLPQSPPSGTSVLRI